MPAAQTVPMELLLCRVRKGAGARGAASPPARAAAACGAAAGRRRLRAVPSSLHEALVDLFRDRPTLAATLLTEALGVAVPAHRAARVVESSLNDVRPTEYRADLVIELADGAGRPALAVIVEAQLEADADKPFTWPAYVATLRARKRCPVCLLVVAPDEALAAWCRRPLELGPGTGALTPRVLGPRAVPVVTARAAARRNPELAVLSALTHGNDPGGERVITAMLGALGAVDEPRRRFYINLIASRLNAATRAALEAMMEAGQADGELIDFMGQVEAKLEARLEARLRARLAPELEARGEARALLNVLAARGLAVGDAVRARITACTDLATLDRWIARAATARTADEVVADE
jgi:hypothetical protein